MSFKRLGPMTRLQQFIKLVSFRTRTFSMIATTFREKLKLMDYCLSWHMGVL